jgi:hypothetical protein
LGGGILLAGEGPVGQRIEPSFQKALPVFLMIQIIGVFPHIADDQRGGRGFAAPVFGIMAHRDGQATAGIRHQPHPA